MPVSINTPIKLKIMLIVKVPISTSTDGHRHPQRSKYNMNRIILRTNRNVFLRHIIKS